MLRVLFNAYACCPNMGSEPGMGWSWIMALAPHCECYIISEGEFQSQVEHWLGQEENKKIAERLHFYWLPIGGKDARKSERIRKMCWNQGDWRFYYYYRQWQKHAQKMAAEIIKDQTTAEPIQIIHQLNMIGFREPGYLWREARKFDIPLVWGPINAKEKFPMNYAENASIKQRLFLWLKNVITRLQLSVIPRVRMMASQSEVIIAANRETLDSAQKYWHKPSVCINETGCPKPAVGNEPTRIRKKYTSSAKRLNILWCGRLNVLKQLDLAIRAIAKTGQMNVALHIVGGGDDRQYRTLAEQLGANVVWYGMIPHDDVLKMMQEMDVFLFTSVSEGTSTVVMEAISMSLPVICFDCCGMANVVDDTIGFKVPLTNIEQSVSDFANILQTIYEDRSLLQKRADGCAAKAEEFSWESKAKQVVEIYRSLL